MTKEEAQRLTDENEVRTIYYREEGSKVVYWAVGRIAKFDEIHLKFDIYYMQDKDNQFAAYGTSVALAYSEVKDII